MPKTIDALYAWICTEPDGGEGIPVVMIEGITLPLVGADMDRMKSLRSFAESAQQASGWPMRLVRFGRREDLEEL